MGRGIVSSIEGLRVNAGWLTLRWYRCGECLLLHRQRCFQINLDGIGHRLNTAWMGVPGG
jgi:hypothetical protein